MAFKWTWSDGTVEPAHSEPAGPGCWYGARVNVVKCEWVEPKTEYRWRWTHESGLTIDYTQPIPVGPNVWKMADDPIVKVERIEVDA